MAGAVPPQKIGQTRCHRAQGLNKIYASDVNYLPRTVRGPFFYLYLILNVYSRKIAGSEVFLGESAVKSEGVIKRALLREGVAHRPTVLNGDNAPAVKAATLAVCLNDVSFTRP